MKMPSRWTRGPLLVAVVAAFAAAAPAGAQVASPAAGVLMPVAGKAVWTTFRSYTFDVNGDGIMVADQTKAREIADHLRKHPTFRVGIDGWNARRVNNIRDALINAGVAENRIQTGAFAELRLRREGLVSVMVSE